MNIINLFLCEWPLLQLILETVENEYEFCIEETENQIHMLSNSCQVYQNINVVSYVFTWGSIM